MLPLIVLASALAITVKATPVKRDQWNLVADWQGSSFFDNWSFFTQGDPTNGDVTYVDQGTAQANGLISVNSAGHAVMGVQTTNVVSGNRMSVRLHGNLLFTGGLVIMDSYHMPEGCGTWPAFWSYNSNWPYGGEIDVVEGIHDRSMNQASLHTGNGCTLPQNIDDTQRGTLVLGSGYDAYQCYALAGGDQSCGVLDETSDFSYGAPFNNAGGGVYALLWTTSTIEVYFFPRSNIPNDITNNSPDPSGWGTPLANFASSQCNPMEYFYNHFSVFDTTLCGAWAGADAVWTGTSGGQSQSCAAETGYSTCTDYIRNEGQNLNNAYWEVGYVKYFNSTSL